MNRMSADELFEFRPPQAPQKSWLPPWKVLSVEDDPDYQSSLLYALGQIRVDDRPIEVLCARSAIEAARILPEHLDIAIVLLDVVMEQDDAGLRLVRTIRDVICNNQIRIVLLTGQPGMAPQPEVLRDYEIDDYWCKSEMTHEHLTSVITGNLRTWDRTTQLERARQGLQLIVEASQALGKRRDLESYTQTLLTTLSQLLRVDRGGIICALSSACQPLGDSIILAACGPFSNYKQRPLKHLPDPELLPLCQQALQQQRHLYTPHHTVLYFAAEQMDDQAYITLIQTDHPPSPAESNLLEVFCENISTGFANLALYNRISCLAFQDPLLNLPNRNHLKQTLQQLGTEDRSGYVLWVIKLDELNETALYFGEAFCDSVLRSIKARLQTISGKQLTLARIDRSTFAMLFPTDDAPQARELEEQLKVPLMVDDSEHLISSVAAALPLRLCDRHEPEQILRLAELAVAEAQEQGQHFTEYERALERRMRQHYHLLDELRQALKHDALTIMLQPKVDLDTGQAVGFEALVRWPREDGRIIGPDQFIPVAETAGLISELDLCVLRRTLETLRYFRTQGLQLPISFNTSSIDLLRPGYFEEMLSLIEASGLPAELLELEVTETQAMNGYNVIAAQLHQLLEMGIGVSIDDFGTGYSSLAHITELAATVLKIDRSFVTPLGTSDKANHIVDMIVRLGERFDFSIIAEGIETEFQRRELLQRGCRYGQGFLFARPLPPEQALAWALERAG